MNPPGIHGVVSETKMKHRNATRTIAKAENILLLSRRTGSFDSIHGVSNLLLRGRAAIC